MSPDPTRIADPIRAMQSAVRDFLCTTNKNAKVEFDTAVSPTMRWRPHIFQRDIRVGWQLHPVEPDSESWERRIRRAQISDSTLKIGIVTLEEAFSSSFLIACYSLDAQIILMKSRKDGYVGGEHYWSVADMICERRIKLTPDAARTILDLALQRALEARRDDEKGITLEVLVAILLSQVDNFEVEDIGISNRSQQMDVLVHNRAVGGVLSKSPLVLAEAKNWRKKKVTPVEYAVFLRKLETRHRQAKLGVLVTSGAFTGGVPLELRRESKSDVLVVLIDGKELPRIWRGPESITKRFERLVIEASVGD